MKHGCPLCGETEVKIVEKRYVYECGYWGDNEDADGCNQLMAPCSTKSRCPDCGCTVVNEKKSTYNCGFSFKGKRCTANSITSNDGQYQFRKIRIAKGICQILDDDSNKVVAELNDFCKEHNFRFLGIAFQGINQRTFGMFEKLPVAAELEVIVLTADEPDSLGRVFPAEILQEIAYKNVNYRYADGNLYLKI